MKKKTSRAKKTVSKKSPSRSVSKESVKLSFFPLSFRRIIFIATCLLLFVIVAVTHKNILRQDVAGVSLARGLFAQATVSWTPVTDAVSYNIYYKQVSDTKYMHAVRKIPTNVTTYTISYLKKNETYQYRVSAVDASGKEFWWSDLKTFSATTSM
ncbi:MAG TPA: fibronectin type III domain-containing protein [Methylomirabilota bacterium]|nr:fibronectin type III domain-containing protein [Methylomirabilota bacterium]